VDGAEAGVVVAAGLRNRRTNVSITRGGFLATSVAAAFALPRGASAAEPTAEEKANLALVTAFCASFADRDMTKIVPLLSDNVVYRITETAAPLSGKDAIDRIRTYVERSTKIEFKILESWAKGSIVVNERIDSFEPAPPRSPFHLTGVFFVKDGKIAEWTDYGIR
jgi:limonene-1,2-epoxide hydrolase